MDEERKDDVSGLTLLGAKKTEYVNKGPVSDMLEVFVNRYQGRNYMITLEFTEFSSLCPRTGQPDFGKIVIEYIPDKLCVETKSLKLYFFAFRSEGSFMESLTNKIHDDFKQACSPKWLVVRGEFAPRGAIRNLVQVESGDDG